MLALITPALGDPRIEEIGATVITEMHAESSFLRLGHDPAGDRLVAFALLDGVSLEVAGENLWRVCDRHAADGPARFMALIDEKDGQFGVMQMGDDYIWSVFPSMWDALSRILRTHGYLSSERAALAGLSESRQGPSPSRATT